MTNDERMPAMTGVAVVLLFFVLNCAAEDRGELLYNGIRLPAKFPPTDWKVPQTPELPAYLVKPPELIPIDVGRQLFVDDFLIAETTLQRKYHRATYHPKTPVLVPDKPWEQMRDGSGMAMAFSDGAWYDPADKLFKMWYMAGQEWTTCYATSADGITWDKPNLDVKPGTNIVQTGKRDSSTIWLDHQAKDPQKRFKMFRSCPGGSTVPRTWGLATFFSPDGIHWTEKPLLTGSCGDRSTVYFNPFRNVWVYSLRQGWGQPRLRRYWEVKDPETGPLWSAGSEAPLWCGADSADPQRESYKTPCQLYNLDATAYESVLLGLFTIWRGQQKDRQKPNEVLVGFSRDGWSWHRPDRQPFCPISENFGDWNYANVQSVGGGCLVVGEQLYFYVSGRGGAKGTNAEGRRVTGLATLRRDGFASMEAGETAGTLTTRPLTFKGKHLFVNLDAAQGELRVEVVDEKGAVLASSEPLKGNATKLPVKWAGRADLADFSGKPVRFKFTLRAGALYSFWVSPESSGASFGYVGAGGPGFTGPMDTTGN